MSSPIVKDVNDELMQMHKRAEFIGNCHNIALDRVMNYVEVEYKKGEEINLKNVRDSIVYIVSEESAKFCGVELDSSIIYKFKEIDENSDDLVNSFFETTDNFKECYDLINNNGYLSEQEKQYANELLDICRIQDYQDFSNQLKLFGEEIENENVVSENIFNMLSVVTNSSRYWHDYMSNRYAEKSWFGFWQNVGMGDFVGLLAGMAQGVFTCPPRLSLIFGPGGYVYCVMGNTLWGAVFGSVVSGISYCINNPAN